MSATIRYEYSGGIRGSVKHLDPDEVDKLEHDLEQSTGRVASAEERAASAEERLADIEGQWRALTDLIRDRPKDGT